jgi:chromosomal replication initiator protein
MSQAALPMMFEEPAGEQLEMFPEFNIMPLAEVLVSTDAAAERAARLWQSILPEAARWLGDAVAQNWLSHLVPTGLSDDTLILAAPSKLIQEWVQSRYADDVLRLLRRQNANLRFLHLYVDPDAEAVPVSLAPAGADAAPLMAMDEPAVPLVNLGAPIDARLTFDRFVVDKSNQLAFEAARRVAAADRVEFNPLFLHGGVGLGKTHLLHAIANDIQARNPRRRVLYLSAEQFMYQFIRALRDKNTFGFKEMFRAVDVLMIDDVQFIAGKESTQEEFFHTFNALVEQGKQIILSADKSPGDLTGVGARLTSRMGMGLVADIHSTSYELRLGVLHARAEQAAVKFPPEVLAWLATHITSNIREVEGALNRLVAHAQLTGAAVTLEFAQRVLADQLRTQSRRLTLEDIQKQVAQYYGIRLQDFLSARRARAVARPRQLAMFLSKQLTTASLPEIGRSFGGRDHTTVAHAVRTVENLLQTDAALAEAHSSIRRALA